MIGSYSGAKLSLEKLDFELPSTKSLPEGEELEIWVERINNKVNNVRTTRYRGTIVQLYRLVYNFLVDFEENPVKSNCGAVHGLCILSMIFDKFKACSDKRHCTGSLIEQ